MHDEIGVSEFDFVYSSGDTSGEIDDVDSPGSTDVSMASGDVAISSLINARDTVDASSSSATV